MEGVTSVEASCHCDMLKTREPFDGNSRAGAPEVLDCCSAFTSSQNQSDEGEKHACFFSVCVWAWCCLTVELRHWSPGERDVEKHWCDCQAGNP